MLLYDNEHAFDMYQRGFGQDVLSSFDVPADTVDFLSDLFESGSAPVDEVNGLLQQSLIAGAEDWRLLIDCASSIRERCNGGLVEGIAGSDVLTYVWLIQDGRIQHAQHGAWENTDRLIALAKDLEEQASDLSSSRPDTKPLDCAALPTLRGYERSQGQISSYWVDQGMRRPQDATLARAAGTRLRTSDTRRGHQTASRWPNAVGAVIREQQVSLGRADGRLSCDVVARLHGSVQHDAEDFRTQELEPSIAAHTSPYFLTTPSTNSERVSKRPPAGTVSCVPFPPLSNTRFGIIQEELAHEPFWLLIAVTFLIKTSGRYAIPVFWKVRERYPTPAGIADAGNTEAIVAMIRHLGLSANRLGYFRRYARAFLERPPRAGVRYTVRNYEERDSGARPQRSGLARGREEESPEGGGDDQDLDAWEIGHMTQGQYAIDSWRIFCRDELLGRAQDWNGKGREPEFQPEWMRVRPQDKELRAFLRWMWMREGWEWDPATGERQALRPEMQAAVEERRVEYDDAGCLRITDQPRRAQ